MAHIVTSEDIAMMPECVFVEETILELIAVWKKLDFRYLLTHSFRDIGERDQFYCDAYSFAHAYSYGYHNY